MLYIVATPIGNLEDLSLRQVKTIASANIILAEDTRSAGILLDFIVRNYDIERKADQKVISYYKEKEYEKLPEVLEILKTEADIALISESGMPVVSDPGAQLLERCAKEGIPYTVIPGPSAVTTALVASGLSFSRFTFIGFLPKKESEVVKTFQNHLKNGIIKGKEALVFFESLKRIQRTLEILNSIDPKAQVAICRELTKKFEEVVRGTPAELAKQEFRGEITVVVKFSK